MIRTTLHTLSRGRRSLQPSFSIQQRWIQSTTNTTAATPTFPWLIQESYETTSGNLQMGICSRRMGHLSESSVLARAGGSVVHCAVNSGPPEATPTEDFLPLTVDYRARHYAYGIISEGNRGKEKHGGDDEILVARFVDRAVRALFPKGYVDDVQVLVTAHAADGIHDPTVLAVNAASLALLRSRQPWYGPIGCVRVGMVDNQLKVNPTVIEMEKSPLDLLYAGTQSRAVMIEAGGNQIPEQTMKDALQMAHNSIQEIIELQLKSIVHEVKTVDGEVVKVPTEKRARYELHTEIHQAVKAKFYQDAITLYRSNLDQKEGRSEQEGKFRADVLTFVDGNESWQAVDSLIKAMTVDKMMHDAFRDAILTYENTVDIRRSDGRSVTQLRPIDSRINVMPSVHGSSYFSRGDTHVLASTTLGPFDASRFTLPINGLGIEKREFFMLHYDFPPYCTGELGDATKTNRRMIGHGNLAEKAIKPILPSFEEFPYTVRVFSECTSSNGSSSMASACGATLSLLDAGVPIKAPVAGVSIGLMTEDNFQYASSTSSSTSSDASTTAVSSGKYVLLKDILGSEDHNGDMDFKVAGSPQGITAIQLDVKLAGGVPLPILFEAMDLAKEGRLEILQKMLSNVPQQDQEQQKQVLQEDINVYVQPMKPHTPRAELIKFDAERKSQLIGPNGEMMNFIEELYQVQLSLLDKIRLQHIKQDYVSILPRFQSSQHRNLANISDTDDIAVAYLFGYNHRYVAQARHLIEDIAVTVKEGDVLLSTISEIKDYGLLVQLNRGQQALLHISELSHDGELLKKPIEELVKKGHRMEVKIVSVDRATGIVKVSRKALMSSKESIPDAIRMLPPLLANETADSLSEVDLSATFPTTPPRPWSRDFFKLNVASEKEVKKAMDAKFAAEQGEASSSTTTSKPNNKYDRNNKNSNHNSRERSNNKDASNDRKPHDRGGSSRDGNSNRKEGNNKGENKAKGERVDRGGGDGNKTEPDAKTHTNTSNQQPSSRPSRSNNRDNNKMNNRGNNSNNKDRRRNENGSNRSKPQADSHVASSSSDHSTSETTTSLIDDALQHHHDKQVHTSSHHVSEPSPHQPEQHQNQKHEDANSPNLVA